MRLHILGIGGTFMAGVAALARALGHEVRGSDRALWPPMSEQVNALGLDVRLGYRPENLDPTPDLVLVGNALGRGNPELEAVLARDLPYESGPRWLFETVLGTRTVIAVAGTHGKTTTTSLLVHLLTAAGLEPGYLVGGRPGDGRLSAALGRTPFFVVEADEYDTAFFDKRPKFVHYRPRVAVLNNLEYDHADIYPDLAAVRQAFHQLVRTVPGHGRLVVNRDDPEIARVLALGCWSSLTGFGLHDGSWRAEILTEDASRFVVRHEKRTLGTVAWELLGAHNVANALAALAAVEAAGVDPAGLLPALAAFRPPRRRLERLGVRDGIHVYDDFAHHPTAIAATLRGLRSHVAPARVVVALEPRSNSMRAGVHREALAGALAQADLAVLLLRPDLSWDPSPLLAALGERALAVPDVEGLLAALAVHTRAGDHVLFMSNGDFGAAPLRFVAGDTARP
jgi:UDP-N-acetylmuramate: L-alanyl-gamma-D-glutamyl-meso-diaminopimelate ligase